MRRDREGQADRMRARLVVVLVAWALDMPVTRVLGEGRDARESAARHIAFYITRVAFGMSLSRVAAAFGRDRSTIASACPAVEDRGDDARFDRWMEALERAAASAPAPMLRRDAAA